MPRFDRTLVIINPTAGFKRRPRTMRLIEDHFKHQGTGYEVRETRRQGDALRWARAARAEGFDLVAVVGGDGTVREVVEGLMRSGARIPLALIPTGTGNVTARALFIPIDIRKALNVIASGRAATFDIGYLPEHDRYFVFVAGAGYDAALIHDTSQEMKRTFGFFAYIVNGVKNFFKVRRVTMELELDGKVTRLRAHTIMVINIGTFGKIKWTMAPDVDPHDGKLNVLVLASRSFWGTFATLLRIIFMRHRYPAMKLFKASRVRIKTDPPLPVQIDGEALGATPFLAEVIPAGIQLVVPRDYA